MGLDHQHRVCREAQPRHPPAGGGNWTPGQYAMPGRSGLEGAVGLVPSVSQLCLTLCEPVPSAGGGNPYEWNGIGQGVATVYASDGSRIDGPCVVAHRGAVLPGTAVASAADSMNNGVGCCSSISTPDL